MVGAWAMDQNQIRLDGAVDVAYGSSVAQASLEQVGRASAHVPGPGFPFRLLVGPLIINFHG